MKKKFLDIVFDETKNLNEVARELRDMSVNFFNVGNKFIGHALLEISDEVYKSSKAISAGHSADLDKQVKESHEMTKTVVGAALAMTSQEVSQ